MIATNILVVECDGCGHKDIFNVDASDGVLDIVAYVAVSRPDLEREGWVEKNLGSGPQHFCPKCKYGNGDR